MDANIVIKINVNFKLTYAQLANFINMYSSSSIVKCTVLKTGRPKRKA